MNAGKVHRVLGLGDNVCDVYLHSGLMYPGGQALNAAVYAARLGAKAAYMGVFGSDGIARHIRDTLMSLDVDTGLCRQVEGRNGYACVTLRAGDRVFLYSNKGGVLQMHPIAPTKDELTAMAAYGWIHTSNNGFTDGLLPKLTKLPAILSYDFSYRWAEKDRVERVCPHVDVAFFSGGDLTADDVLVVCEEMRKNGCSLVVATLGSRGALALADCGQVMQAPKLVKPLDTLGAGDSFAAAMMMALLEGGVTKCSLWRISKNALQQAMEQGAAFAAETCLMPGAFGHEAPIPHDVLEELRPYMTREEQAGYTL